ncbi:MAG: type II toxin-antitoxin system VapC family toxin [Acidobacteria bacterium]|nr:type II toxin-antitoxin system VapC family toxin [Acidobacteriota bacterium]
MTLIDTTPLVALCDPRDSWHARATTHLERLSRGGLCTSEAVLVEASFHLAHPAQRRRLQAFLAEFGVVSVETLSDEITWAEVLDWLAKYGDHEPDWADAAIAVLSEHHAGIAVWTYDREFRTIWRRPNGTAIPMAVK